MNFTKPILFAIAVALIAPSSAIADLGHDVPGRSKLALVGFPQWSDLDGDDFYYATPPTSDGVVSQLVHMNFATGASETLYTAERLAGMSQNAVTRVVARGGKLTFVLRGPRESRDAYTAIAMNSDGSDVRTIAETEIKNYYSGSCGTAILFATPTARGSEIVAMEGYANPKHAAECPAFQVPAGHVGIIETHRDAPPVTLRDALPPHSVVTVVYGDHSWGVASDGLRIAYIAGSTATPRRMQMVDLLNNKDRSWKLARGESFETMDVAGSGRVLANILHSRGSEFGVNRFVALPVFGQLRASRVIATRRGELDAQVMSCGDQSFIWSERSPSQMFWPSGRRHGKAIETMDQAIACNEKWLSFYERSGRESYFKQQLSILQ